jgi:hypothetical protein
VGKHLGPEGRSESYDQLQPQKLSPRMKSALRLVYDGWSQKDIAEATGYNQPRIAILANSDVGKVYLEELDSAVTAKVAGVHADFAASPKKMDVRKRLEDEAATSLETLLAIRDGSLEDPRLLASVSQDLLDRAGYKSPDKVEVDARVLATQPVIDALNFLRSRQRQKES